MQMWRHMQHQLTAAQQNTGPVGMAHKRVKIGQFMVAPRPHKPMRQNQGRRCAAQGLFKICALLFGHKMDLMGRNAQTRLCRQAI